MENINNFEENSNEEKNPTEDSKYNKSKFWKNLKEMLISFIVAFCLALFISKFIFSINAVSGSSMHPTLEHKDRLIELKIDKWFRPYKKGDIVIFKNENQTENSFYCKRIIGTEGDHIQIMDGKVYVNGELLKEDYIEKDILTEGYIDVIVSSEHVFVLGDNREPFASRDSRIFGEVSIKDIDGRLVFRFWPLNKIGIV